MPETNPFTEQFVSQLPGELVKDAAALKLALDSGYLEFTEWKVVLEQRHLERSVATSLGELAKKLHEIEKCESKFSFQLDLLDRFAGPNDASVRVLAPTLARVKLLVSEYQKWFSNPKGGQAKTKSDFLRLDTLPLEAFVEQIKADWYQFAHRQFTVGPNSQALRLVHLCARELEPGVTSQTCFYLMRKVKDQWVLNAQG